MTAAERPGMTALPERTLPPCDRLPVGQRTLAASTRSRRGERSGLTTRTPGCVPFATSRWPIASSWASAAALPPATHLGKLASASS